MHDLLALFTLLDTNKVKLPVFYAVNPSRLPLNSSVFNDASVSALSSLTSVVNDLKEQIASLSQQVSELRGTPTVRVENARVDGTLTTSASNVLPPETSVKSVVTSGQPTQGTEILLPPAIRTSNLSWAERMAATHKPSDAASTNTARRIGTRTTATSAVKTVARSIACFVGRLHPDTTEQDMKNYLNEVGIHDAKCKKLVAKDGRIFNTAAFYVSCSNEFRETFYNENNWPEGAELRDWYYRSKNGSTD